MAAGPKRAKPVLRQDWRIGSASAEHDEAFLDNCFVDTGAINDLASIDSNKSIILGRVGAGKSALLREIEKREHHVRRLRPQDFSLRYISNSNVLQFVAELGVKLDPVFQALWKHVLCVELLRLRYNVTSAEDSKVLWGRITATLSMNESKRRALDYFAKFGGTDFWETTEVRIREITKKIEKGIEDSLGAKYKSMSGTSKSTKRLTEEERLELVSNVRTFLNTIQMSSLQDVITILKEGDFAKSKNKYFIIVDDLDEQWADDELRFRLIRALIETIKRFREIRCAKVVVAIRNDLLSTVLEATRDSGFQEEKFEDFFHRIRWSDQQLKNVVNLRMERLIKHKYTSKSVGFYDIFPRQVRKIDTYEYLLRRTLKRPRDIILFANQCLEEASGKAEITPSIVQDAERSYSEGRLTSLSQEWFDSYPQLKTHIEFLKGLRSRFSVEDIPAAHINDYLLGLYKFDGKVLDPITDMGLRIATDGGIESTGQALPFLRTLFSALYRIGIVGIRRPPNGRFVWNEQPSASALAETIEPTHAIAIHPMLYGALETRVVPDSE